MGVLQLTYKLKLPELYGGCDVKGDSDVTNGEEEITGLIVIFVDRFLLHSGLFEQQIIRCTFSVVWLQCCKGNVPLTHPYSKCEVIFK